MTPQRVLFVGGEPSVLDGLRDLFRRDRRECDMTFAQGGSAALAVLAQTPCDVVVTDMCMAPMDGAMLLEHVKAKYPCVVRILLCGDAGPDLARMLPVAHQIFSKPCDAEQLREGIRRARALESVLPDESLRQLVGSIDRLPSLPDSCRRLASTLACAETLPEDVAAIVAEDPAMSAKVMQLANSGYFGAPEPIVSLREAVSFLGVDLIRDLRLHEHAPAVSNGTASARSLQRLQEHSVATARLAASFLTSPEASEEAFTAGLLHDVGRFVLSLSTTLTGEHDALNVSEAEIGAYLLGLWGLPSSIVDVVAYHHTPDRAPSGEQSVLAAVHVADALIGGPADGNSEYGELNTAFLDAGGWLPDLPRWCALAADATLADVGGTHGLVLVGAARENG